jgi:preprotein translocase SecE subunit
VIYLATITAGQERLNVANKMADKKRNASRSQVTAVKSQVPEKEKEKEPSTKSVKAAPREERKAQPKQESKPVRRESKSSPTLTARVRSNRLGRFTLDAYYELRHKVTWPTFQEARNMTVVVIILSAVIGAILAGADYGLYHLFAFISGAGK